MPKSQEIIKSFSYSGPTALIVNEIGPIGSHLADSLLGLGCNLYYFGNKKKDKIDHLFGKSNFELIDGLDRIYEIPSLTYVFYLADSRGKYLTEIAQKIKDKKTKLLFAFPGKEEVARKLQEELTSLGLDARICLFGEIYGPRLEEELFSSVLSRAVFGGRMKIPLDGTAPISLVFYSDFIKGLNQAIFAPDTSGKIFYLGGEPVSCLMFLGELEKKVSNLPQIEFGKNEEAENKALNLPKNEPSFDWQPEIKLAEGISKTIAWLERSKQVPSKKSPKNIDFFKAPASFKKKFLFGLSTFLFLIFIFFLFPIIAFWVSFSSAQNNFIKTKKDWEKGDLLLVSQSLGKTKADLTRAKKIFELAAPFFDLIGLGASVRQIEPFLSGGGKFLDSADSFLTAVDIFFSLSSSVVKGEKVDFSVRIDQTNKFLEKAYLDNSLALGVLKDNWDGGQMAKFLKADESLKQGKTFLPEFRQEIIKLRVILLNFPELVGKNGKRSYLLILQNNLELRPSGGFIGSYGILTFDDGQLVNFDFKDVSVADSQLRGQIEPPGPIKEYLKESSWYLKDAGWDPDFTVSAERIAWFFEKETGRQFDGVMAVNLNMARRILSMLGEVNVEKFQEKIDAANIIEKAVYYSNSGSFPGSGQNLDFFAELGKAILEKLRTSDFNQLGFFRAVVSSLAEKDLTFFFYNPQVAELIKSFNWGGSLIYAGKDSLCQNIKNKCLEDYLFINEANLGRNRANFFLKRMINYSVLLTEEGKFKQTLKINYQNLSLSETWPAGRYKNYLRIILPEKTSLESVMLNDSADPNYWLQIPEGKVDVATASGKISYGFLVEIPPKSSRTVEVKYSLPKAVDLTRPFTYLVSVQKQSGVSQTPYSLTFSFPNRLQPLKILPHGTFSSGGILINEVLDRDKIFQIDFQP